MIQNYLNFNIAKFVADCYDHEKILPSLIEQLNDLDGVKGIDTTKDKVQASPTNDGMVNLVIVRQRLYERIQDYQHDLKLFKAALSSLTEEEQEAIDICFNGKNVQKQLAEKHIEERTLYQRRKRALDKLARIIVG